MSLSIRDRFSTYGNQLYGHFMHDSLRRSSTFLLGSSGVASLFGFAFWLLVAHLTSSVQVGYAASLLAYINLYSTVTTLGLTNAVVRFLPKHKNKDAYFGSVLAITLNSSILLGAGLIEIIRFLSPKLLFAVNNPAIFAILLLILVVSSLSSITDAALLAHKDTKHVFLKAVWQSPVKVILPFLFVGLGLQGILIVYAISALIGTVYELIILYRKHHQRFIIDTTTLDNTYRFVAGNFMGTIFGIFPATLVPIIVLNELGASVAAYFFIALQFASLLSIISSSSAQAYLSEASNDHESQYMHHLVKAMRNLYSMLLPIALLMIVVGTQALRFYGYAYYTHAAVVLILLSIASLFVGINWLGDSLLNVQKRPMAYGLMNFINALLVVAFVRLTASGGLADVGKGWIIAQALTVVIYVVLQREYLWPYVTRLKIKASKAQHRQPKSLQQFYPKLGYYCMLCLVDPSPAIRLNEWQLVREYFVVHQVGIHHRNIRQPEADRVVPRGVAPQPAYRMPMPA
jgi:O-antigen/teichoic acid export membrane protein